MSGSKYLSKFIKLNDHRDKFKLHGGRVLIELMPTEEIKSAGGIIVAAPSNYAKGSTAETSRGTLATVLLSGEGYVGSEGEEYELDAKPGKVVLINELGLKTFSVFPGLADYTANSIALIDEGMIQMSWNSLEDYEAYCNLLK